MDSTPPPPPFFNFFGGDNNFVSSSPPQSVTESTAATVSSSSNSSTGVSNSAVILVIVFSVTVIVSISLCFVIRILSRRCRRASGDGHDEESGAGRNSLHVTRVVTSLRVQPVLELLPVESETNRNNSSLPVFTFEELKGGGGRDGAEKDSDCAICLSKFEPNDQLRLLPICCHAFHADCVDAWLKSNQTCPLCRSAIFESEAEILKKVLAASSGRSFRLELGNISSRRQQGAEPAALVAQRSYSIGSFDYVVDEVAQVSVEPRLIRVQSEDKMEPNRLASEVGSNRSWLSDCVERLSSRTASFRSSGRYITGSSRRSEMTVAAGDDGYPYYWDTEAGRAGEEISEMFRWFSGI